MAIYEIPDEQYRSMDALSQSMAKRLLDSGMRYRYEQPMQTDAFRVGNLIDTMTLTPALAEERFIVTPDFAAHPDNVDAKGNPSTSSRTTWAKEQMSLFGKRHSTQVFVSREEWQTASLLASRIRSKPMVKCWLENDAVKTQLAITGTIRGVECKMLSDLIVPTTLIDLKSTKDASKRSFRGDFFRYRYGFQFAWYRMLANQNGYNISRDQCYVIAACKLPPHDVVVYSIPERWIVDAEIDVATAVDRYKEYTAANNWPGADGGLDSISLGESQEIEVEWDV